MLGSWVRAPSGSPKEKPKGDNKKTSPTTKRQVLQNQYFVGLFLLPFGDLDRQKEGIDGQKIVPNSYPDKFFKKGVRFTRNITRKLYTFATVF